MQKQPKKNVITCPDKQTAYSHPLVYIDLTHTSKCPYCGKNYGKKRKN